MVTNDSVHNYCRIRKGEGKIVTVLNQLNTTACRCMAEWRHGCIYSQSRYQMEVSGRFQSPVALFSGKYPLPYHWLWGWLDLRARLDAVEKYLALPWIESRFLGHSTHSRSLYCLSYPGSLQECYYLLTEYFIFSWVWSLGTLVWNGPVIPALDERWVWNICGIVIARGKWNCLEKTVLPICPQIPRRPSWNWTRDSAVRTWLPTSWAVARRISVTCLRIGCCFSCSVRPFEK